MIFSSSWGPNWAMNRKTTADPFSINWVYLLYFKVLSPTLFLINFLDIVSAQHTCLSFYTNAIYILTIVSLSNSSEFALMKKGGHSEQLSTVLLRWCRMSLFSAHGTCFVCFSHLCWSLNFTLSDVFLLAHQGR